MTFVGVASALLPRLEIEIRELRGLSTVTLTVTPLITE